MEIKSLDFFVAGGALPPNSSSYIKRLTDNKVCDLALAGQPGYVVAPPHMGKSSLMIRTAEHLQKQNIRVATLYLSGLSATTGAEAWYLELVTRLKLLLKLAANVEGWWAERATHEVSQRFINFLGEVALAEISEPIVIFIDEIETLRDLKFSPGFLAALRSLYEARAGNPSYQRLTFMLLGSAVPVDLIKDSARSPFAISPQLELHDFSRAEADVFQDELAKTYPEQAETIFSRIYYWTAGQPYLTQKLCLAVNEMNGQGWRAQQADSLVDRLVEKLFLSPAQEPDLNLLLLRESLAGNPQRRQLLALYRQVYEGQIVAEEGPSPEQQRLKLLGLVRGDQGHLRVSNMIYRQVFNLNWLKSSPASTKWTRYLIAALILVALGVTMVLGFAIYNQVEQVIAAQAQPFLDSFNSTTNPNVRLTSLAGLFNLPGYQEEARRSFFDQLSPEEQLDLFAEQTDPQTAGPDLITVIQGVYTAPNLENNEQDNALLLAMALPLKQLVDDPSSPGAVSLELEITQWLKGRESYNRGEYRQAVSAYQRAIELNDQNPGTFFDRGLAYAALGESNLALADLSTALTLDETWRPRAQQALSSDSQLYNALWTGSEAPEALIALVPSPTATPTPTDTPTPTPTPTSTPTSTPRPPTATPTLTTTPTLAPITVSTLTPLSAPPTTSASGVPAGTFTLLTPLFVDGPSYGPTRFTWQWSSPLPPEYGFEVRVWREGQPPAGVHNAVLDNQNGTIKSLGNNTYELNIDIKNAAGVLGRSSGEYLWSVSLVRVSPKYRDLGQQAPPRRFLFAAPGASGGSGGDEGDGGSGGVGID